MWTGNDSGPERGRGSAEVLRTNQRCRRTGGRLAEDPWDEEGVKAKPVFLFVPEQTSKCPLRTRQALCCAWGRFYPSAHSTLHGDLITVVKGLRRKRGMLGGGGVVRTCQGRGGDA